MKFLSGIDLNGQRARSAGDASSPTDLVTLQQLQAFVRGLDWKDAVAAASTGNINLAAPGSSIDGVNMSTSGNKRFLSKDQTDATTNGIYFWNGAAVPATRVADADSSAEVTQGMAVTVIGGSVNRINNQPAAFVLTTNDPITLGTTALSFTQLGGSSAPYVAGMGLILTGSTFDVGQGNGIIVEADAIRVDASVVVRKYAANCAATTNPQIFTHALGTDDVQVTVRENGVEVVAESLATGGTVSVDFGGAPAAAQYRVSIRG